MIVALSSCDATKYLTDEQSLIKGTKIVFKSNKTVKDKSQLEAELLTFVTVKPNTKLLFFIPKEWIYLKGATTIGEPPSIYDESATVQNVKNMENYLRFKKGYYNAKVDFLVEEKRSIKGWETTRQKSVWESNVSDITYLVSLGDRYKIGSLEYISEDKNLISFVHSISDGAFVKAGDFIDFGQFELEKSRISIELQNHGFANFSNNYIEIVGDSSNTDLSVDIRMEFRLPLPDTIHQRYVTGNINVHTDFVKEQASANISTELIHDINFIRQSSSFLVKPELINNSIFFRKGEELRRDDRQKTFRKLNSLSTYRFVTINATPSIEHDSIMDFDILLSPYQNKWILDGGIDVYFSTLAKSNLLGTSLSSSLQNRNLFGGSELYTLRAELGGEIALSPFLQRTQNLSIQNTLNLPSFQDFIGLGKMVNKMGIVRDKFYKNFKEEATTAIGLGYNSINIIDYYSLSSFNTSFGFDYTSPRGHRYSFKPLGFNLDLYTIKDSSRFDNNPAIQLSFKDNLGTGFLFRDFSYIYNGAKSKKGTSFLLINNLEFSGVEVYLANEAYNAIANKSDIWRLGSPSSGKSISFAKYIKYEFDGRFYKEFTPTSTFASRLNLGIIVPFGQDGVAPFIKQFSVGGPNSLRAWNIRELGPGGYRDPLTLIKETPTIFVNQGDLKIEANLEYRFKIVLFLDGAFFVDAGNVWTLKKDIERPNAEISNQFLNQIAVGAGYGIRLNFDFFNIRFDFGYKLRSPFKDQNVKSQWYSLNEITNQGLFGNAQVAVNYPF